MGKGRKGESDPVRLQLVGIQLVGIQLVGIQLAGIQLTHVHFVGVIAWTWNKRQRRSTCNMDANIRGWDPVLGQTGSTNL